LLPYPLNTGEDENLQNKEATENYGGRKERVDEQRKIKQTNWSGEEITRTCKRNLKRRR
jgi:hypothetical protein